MDQDLKIIFIALVVAGILFVIVQSKRKRERDMPAGLEVFDESELPIVTLTDYHPRILGVAVLGSGTQSFTVPEFSNGAPFIFTSIAAPAAPQIDGVAVHMNNVTITSNGFTWETSSADQPGGQVFGNGVVVYGVGKENGGI